MPEIEVRMQRNLIIVLFIRDVTAYKALREISRPEASAFMGPGMHPTYCFAAPCAHDACAADSELLTMFSGKVSRSVIGACCAAPTKL